MSEITRPVNINLYLSSGIDDDEAERLAAILSEALDEHGFPRVAPEPVCGAECGDSVHMHRCLLATEPHTHCCDDCGYVWDTVPQVPEWRRLVDAMPPKPFAERHPLAEILERLAVLDEYSDTGVDETRLYQMNLARIVAVCEQQVGDGWQADPDVVPRGHWGIAWLLVPLSHEPPGWTMVGNRAAAWLRDLTEAGTE